MGSGPGSPFGLEDKAPPQKKKKISWMFNFGGFTDFFPWWLHVFKFGLGGTVLKWFTSYLQDTCRSQHVLINGKLSDVHTLEWGVPF